MPSKPKRCRNCKAAVISDGHGELIHEEDWFYCCHDDKGKWTGKVAAA